MSVVVVFPRNNPFSKQNTRPVVLAALPYILQSKFNIKVISPFTETPIENVLVKVLEKNLSTKKYYKSSVLEEEFIKNSTVVEVHQDIKLAALIKKKYPEKKVFVIKHCAVLVNIILDKFYLCRIFHYHKYIKNLDGIYCVSNYVKQLFIKNFPKAKSKFILLYNTYGHIDNVLKCNNTKKENIILFAGKPVRNKGFCEFYNAAIEILNTSSDYKIMIIGAFFSKQYKHKFAYNKFLKKPEVQKFIDNGKLILKNKLTVEEVYKEMSRVKICVVPSKVKEGFGLACLEASMAKCAIISSGSGALPEITDIFSLYLKKVSSKEIFASVMKLINNEKLLLSLGSDVFSYAKTKFNPEVLVSSLDKRRG